MAMPNDAGEHHGEPAAASSGDISTDTAPSSDAPAPSSSAPIGAAEARITSEAPGAQAASASSAKPSPGLPRAAVLTWRPDERIGASGPDTMDAPRPSARAGGRRFALLAAGLTLAAAIGAIAGTAGMAGIEHMLASAPPAPAPATVVVAGRSENSDEVRILKESVAQLKTNVKALSENVAALRSTINLSTSAANTQFTKISESLDRVEKERAADRERAERERAAERERGERRVTVLTPSPEPTGSVPPASVAPAEPKSVTKNPVVEGWLLRRVYGSDSALVEGRYGVVEIVPGDLVPGLGRIQEIKRQDGHWVVVTSRGLIVSAR
jgi:hypothetical protein